MGLYEQEAGEIVSLSGREHTCEGLSAGVDPSQSLGCAKIGYLQDAAVGVDENVITLWIGKTSVRTACNHSLTDNPGS